MINYYEILEVNDFANFEEIKKSYKNLLLTSHPDKGGNQNKFENLKDAFDFLKDADKKKEYDNKLLYYKESMERAEEIEINFTENKFICIQCGNENKIELNNKYGNFVPSPILLQCENCSMIYKIKFNI